MDIQSAAINMSQGQVREEAAIRVEAMGIAAMKEQGAELSKLLQSTQAVTDPNLGSRLNIFA